MSTENISFTFQLRTSVCANETKQEEIKHEHKNDFMNVTKNVFVMYDFNVTNLLNLIIIRIFYSIWPMYSKLVECWYLTGDELSPTGEDCVSYNRNTRDSWRNVK